MPVLLYVYDTEVPDASGDPSLSKSHAVVVALVDPDKNPTVKGTGPDSGDPVKIATGAGSVGPVPPPSPSPLPPPPPPQLINKIKNCR